MEENQRRVGVLTLPVDLRWLNAKLLKVKQPHVKKPPLKELIGIRKRIPRIVSMVALGRRQRSPSSRI